MILRDYQTEAVNKIKDLPLSILSFEMRLGKTAISLSSCKPTDRVLFVTKKKAISSIESDYKQLGLTFDVTIINYESLHKISPPFDVVIVDECHRLGSFPKPCLAVKQLKKLVGNARVVLMSGTITPESFSQIYHQLCISPHTPFKHKNFYAWAKEFVNITQKRLYYGFVNDYSNAKIALIKPYLEPFMFSMTQEQAGFLAPDVEEIVHTVKVDSNIPKAIRRLQIDKVMQTPFGMILFDTPTNALMREHQMWSGTIKTDTQTKILCEAKAKYIKATFKGKFAIYYKYQAEREVIDKHFNTTSDPKEFAETDKVFTSQILAGREGVNLSVCNDLVFYNIDYSYTSYAQTLARMSAKDKAETPRVHFIFAEGGLEHDIYKRVQSKEDFTLEHYRGKYDRH